MIWTTTDSKYISSGSTFDLLKEIDAVKGPVGSTPEGLVIRKEFDFNYRFLLGALVYCGVIVCTDIAY